MSKVYKNMSILLMLYIVLQPILDAVTGLMIHLGTSVDITLGIVARMLVMLAAFFYILLNRKSIPQKQYRILIIYLIVLAVILIANLVTSYYLKPVFSFRTEVTAIAKMLYMPVMLGAYYLAFRDLFTKELITKYFPRVVYYAIMIVDFVMIMAHFTNTNFNSYSMMKSGESGWFFAANETGAILAITLPVVLFFVIQQTQTWKQWYYWIGLFATMYSSILLGTKSGIISIFGTLAVAIVVALVQVVKQRSKRTITLLIIFLITTVGMVFVLPQVSVTQNINVQQNLLKEQRKTEKYISYLQKKKHLTSEEQSYLATMNTGQKEILEGDEIKNTTKSLIFSSRTVYLERINNMYVKAPMTQKLFGMGLGGNYKAFPKTCEMDFFDLFYEFGILGLIVIIAPLLLVLGYLVKEALKNWRGIFTYQKALLLASVGMTVVISGIAGHVLTAPAVAIYFAVILSYLTVEYQNKKTSN